ncbi:MAG: hypothetical protein WAO74_10095 [Polaribacter sp.]|uniref:hypothetical protein n=1 Tax=Polaribacter sp. TaxID=1920175 RepID=UPI003BAF34A9
MKNFSKQFIYTITLFLAIGFTSCENSNEDILETELTIEQKVALLEGSEWLLKGFETNVMHTFADGKRFTYYGSDSVFAEDPIPDTQAYSVSGDLLIMDFNFGNIYTYELKVSCDNNIVEFYRDGELNSTLYKRDSNYQNCL